MQPKVMALVSCNIPEELLHRTPDMVDRALVNKISVGRGDEDEMAPSKDCLSKTLNRSTGLHDCRLKQVMR